jgi:dUTP pyrophosphatase
MTELRSFYSDSLFKHNEAILPVLMGKNKTFDAGFDLICPDMISAVAQKTTKFNHHIRCSMTKVITTSDTDGNIETEHSVGYYLYPRSSTGTKTPLRLANSVGIIDSGYRGDIIAAFDNWMSVDYVVDKGHRIVQLCPPDLSYPVWVVLVESIEDLGVSERGTGGFGSTGR